MDLFKSATQTIDNGKFLINSQITGQSGQVSQWMCFEGLVIAVVLSVSLEKCITDDLSVTRNSPLGR